MLLQSMLGVDYYAPDRFHTPEFIKSLPTLDSERENMLSYTNLNNELTYFEIGRRFFYGGNDSAGINIAIGSGTHIYKQSTDRTGSGRCKQFGVMLTYSCAHGAIPIPCGRLIEPKAILDELVWILSGSTNVKMLQGLGSRFWNRWADRKGSVGPMYGAMTRQYPNARHYMSQLYGGSGQAFSGDETIDQLANVQDSIRNDPHSTRHRMTTFNPSFTPPAGKRTYEENVSQGYGALTPCHGLVVQFHTVHEDGRKILHMSHTQASCDYFVGGAFNMPYYSMLLQLMAHCTGHEAGNVYWTINDNHYYPQQEAKAREYIAQCATAFRQYQQTNAFFNQRFVINPELTDITKLTIDDVAVINYTAMAPITIPVAA